MQLLFSLHGWIHYVGRFWADVPGKLLDRPGSLRRVWPPLNVVTRGMLSLVHGFPSWVGNHFKLQCTKDGSAVHRNADGTNDLKGIATLPDVDLDCHSVSATMNVAGCASTTLPGSWDSAREAQRHLVWIWREHVVKLRLCFLINLLLFKAVNTKF